MVKKIDTWIIKYKNTFIKVFFICLCIFLSVRGLMASWEDFKNYAYFSKLKEQEIISNIVEKEISKKIEPPLLVDKNKELKARVFKEKGIILTDEDIIKYGISK